MIKKVFSFLLVAGLFSGCCTKKFCVGDALPAIEFNFADPAALNGSTVAVKTLLNKTVIDSFLISKDFEQHFSLFPFSFHGDEDGKAKTYEIRIKEKVTVIDNITIDFHQEEFNCNECFPWKVEKEFIDVNDNFSFRNNGRTFFEGEVLTLE